MPSLSRIARGRLAASALLLGLVLPGSGFAQPPDTAAARNAARPVYLEADVDQPVRVVRIDRPEYPPALRTRGVCGWADLTYVVDSTGRAEPPSFTVLNATDPAFGRSAAAALRGAVFSPARRQGVPVRQRVTQRVRFDLAALELGECRSGGR